MTSPSPLARLRGIAPAGLVTMAPPQIDALNAVLGEEFDRISGETEQAWDSLYRAVGIRPVRVRAGRGWRQEWPCDTTELKAKASGLLKEPLDPERARCAPQVRERLAVLDRLAATWRELAEGPRRILDGEWERRGGWSRFFLCLNAGGHIHAGLTGRECGSVRPSTRIGWLPELSGLTMTDAVKAHGTVLCSHCFPDAPVEWTVGQAKPDDECLGSRTYADPATYNTSRLSPFAPCPIKGCGQKVSVTSGGKFRVHKKK